MRYMATIYLSDVLDQVAATLEVQGWSAQYGPPETMCEKTFVWPGYGDDDPVSWLQRFLSRMVEEMTMAHRVEHGGPLRVGGVYTVSESGDKSQNLMG